MSKLDDILDPLDAQYDADGSYPKGDELPIAKQQIKALMLSVIRETEDDPEIYFGDGQRVIEERIKAL